MVPQGKFDFHADRAGRFAAETDYWGNEHFSKLKTAIDAICDLDIHCFHAVIQNLYRSYSIIRKGAMHILPSSAFHTQYLLALRHPRSNQSSAEEASSPEHHGREARVSQGYAFISARASSRDWLGKSWRRDTTYTIGASILHPCHSMWPHGPNGLHMPRHDNFTHPASWEPSRAASSPTTKNSMSFAALVRYRKPSSDGLHHLHQLIQYQLHGRMFDSVLRHIPRSLTDSSYFSLLCRLKREYTRDLTVCAGHRSPDPVN